MIYSVGKIPISHIPHLLFLLHSTLDHLYQPGTRVFNIKFKSKVFVSCQTIAKPLPNHAMFRFKVRAQVQRTLQTFLKTTAARATQSTLRKCDRFDFLREREPKAKAKHRQLLIINLPRHSLTLQNEPKSGSKPLTIVGVLLGVPTTGRDG